MPDQPRPPSPTVGRRTESLPRDFAVEARAWLRRHVSNDDSATADLTFKLASLLSDVSNRGERMGQAMNAEVLYCECIHSYGQHGPSNGECGVPTCGCERFVARARTANPLNEPLVRGQIVKSTCLHDKDKLYRIIAPRAVMFAPHNYDGQVDALSFDTFRAHFTDELGRPLGSEPPLADASHASGTCSRCGDYHTCLPEPRTPHESPKDGGMEK